MHWVVLLKMIFFRWSMKIKSTTPLQPTDLMSIRRSSTSRYTSGMLSSQFWFSVIPDRVARAACKHASMHSVGKSLILKLTTGFWLSFPMLRRIRYFQEALFLIQDKHWAMIWKGRGFLISSFMTLSGNKSYTPLYQTSLTPTR